MLQQSLGSILSMDAQEPYGIRVPRGYKEQNEFSCRKEDDIVGRK